MVKVRLTLVESSKQIEVKINRALLREVNKAMTRVATRIIGPIRSTVKAAILAQPEVASLGGGQLAGEFGLPDGKNKIENIIELWVKNITVVKKNATLRGGQINAGLTLNMIQRDYKDVLSSPFATVRTLKGQHLPWLEWLLRFGDRAIIRDFEISYDRRRLANSRSGLAVMVGREGKRWSVPSQFSGTQQNNLVTRALDTIQDDVFKIIETHLRAI